MQVNAGEAATLLRMLANPSRLLVVCALVSREHTAGELEELVGLSQSAISQHLAKLRQQEIVQTRRRGQNIFYRLGDDRAARVVETLHSLFCQDL